MYRRLKQQYGSFPFRARVLFGVMFFYFCFFVMVYFSKRNGEFFWYALVEFILFLFLFFLYHQLRLTSVLLGAIGVHWLLHSLGGVLYVGGMRLYDFYLIPGFFRWDNLVHAFGVGVLTIVAYNLLRPYFKLMNRRALFNFAFLLVLVVMGVGAMAEITELCAVLWLGAAKTVGDYFNNAFDLVWNLTGSVLACVALSLYEFHRLPRRRKR